jgi:hypothetical protein
MRPHDRNPFGDIFRDLSKYLMREMELEHGIKHVAEDRVKDHNYIFLKRSAKWLGTAAAAGAGLKYAAEGDFAAAVEGAKLGLAAVAVPYMLHVPGARRTLGNLGNAMNDIRTKITAAQHPVLYSILTGGGKGLALYATSHVINFVTGNPTLDPDFGAKVGLLSGFADGLQTTYHEAPQLKKAVEKEIKNPRCEREERKESHGPSSHPLRDRIREKGHVDFEDLR